MSEYLSFQDGEPACLIAVDYQNLHLGSPSTDLYYLIYTASDKNFRKEHLQDLLDHYYNTLSRWLKIMNLDPEKEFSRKDFDKDYKNMSSYALYVATFLLPVVLVETENAPAVEQGSELSEISFKLGETFKSRFLPILDEFVNKGLL